MKHCTGRGRMVSAFTVAVVAAVATLIPAVHATAEPGKPLPGPKKQLVKVLNDVVAQDKEPGLTPAEAVAETVPTLTDGTSTAPAAAAADAAASTVDSTGCVRDRIISATSGSGATRTVTIVGSTATFEIGNVPATWWRDPPEPSEVWNLYFGGFYWASELAPQLATSGDTAGIEALVTTAVKFLTENPDLGTNEDQWDEGTNLRREQALNCLYRVTGGDPRLVPVIESAAKANMDQSRYYGPPLHPAHNHGLMANLALIDSADLLDRPEWRSYAISRLERDAGSVWTPGGFTIEQSSAYGLLNAGMWSDVARLLETYPGHEASVAAIDAGCARARGALSHLSSPLGGITPIGDDRPLEFTPSPQPLDGIRDDTAGIVAGRWSWSDAKTSFYVLRYGGPRRMHGHQDRQSLVWTTRGVPVLVDPGTFSYDPGTYEDYAKSHVGHNTQIVHKSPFNLSAGVNLTYRTSSSPVHVLTLKDALYGRTHTRTWRIDHGRAAVTVSDSVAAYGATSMHLAPEWTLASRSTDGRTLVLTHPSGRRLAVKGTHAIEPYRGSTRLVLGWYFPDVGQRIPAVQLYMQTPPGASSMTLTVS